MTAVSVVLGAMRADTMRADRPRRRGSRADDIHEVLLVTSSVAMVEDEDVTNAARLLACLDARWSATSPDE